MGYWNVNVVKNDPIAYLISEVEDEGLTLELSPEEIIETIEYGIGELFELRSLKDPREGTIVLNVNPKARCYFEEEDLEKVLELLKGIGKLIKANKSRPYYSLSGLRMLCHFFWLKVSKE